jgi:ADP-ribose pyrophosphatase
MPDDAAAKPTLLSTKLVFDGSLYKVRVDKVRLPSGRETVREVIEHPGAIAILAITENDELILVRQYRYSIDESILEIPAGTSEPHESAIETAGRELIEETGYQAAALAELCTYYSSVGYSNERITLIVATGCRRTSNDLAPDEVDEVTLVPRSDARSLFGSGPNQVKEAKSIIGVSMLLAGLISLQST